MGHKFNQVMYFGKVIDLLFDDLMKYGVEFQGELEKLEHIKTENLKRILNKDEFKEFEQVIGVMYRTSVATTETFEHMDNACLEMLKSWKVSSSKDKKEAVQKIMAILNKARKQELAYAKRLPFSIGGGWAPGFSPVRQAVNVVGYLLLAPALASAKGRAMYAKSLETLHDAMKAYRKSQEKEFLKRRKLFPDFPDDSLGVGETGFDPSTKWGGSKEKKEVKNTMKDLQVFARTAKMVVRNWRRARGKVQKIIDNQSLYQIQINA